MENEAIIKMLPNILSSPDPVIFELGANDGRDTEEILKHCKGNYRYFAFEPDPRTAAAMKTKGLDKKVEIVEAAVSSFEGTTTLYQFYDKSAPDQTRGSGPTSIMKPIDNDKRLPHLAHRTDYKAPVITLDAFCQEHDVDRIDFMWVDIQGSEYEMIKGAQQILRNTNWLFMEAMKSSRYYGQKPRRELLAALPGWKLIKDWPVDVLLKRVSK
jgi:FkbM family methyltransferase